MANGQLFRKYLFGINNSNIFFTTPEYDFFIGIPERQKKLVKLAQEQVKVQKELAQSIESSNLHVANEIKQFSENLDESILDLSANINQVGGNIVDSINNLENSILFEFREVRWLISQMSDHLAEVILILKNRRKFEANELLEQSLSNLKNGYYNEAKDRLLKALEYDNTDYQVHRNLGFVFLHDDNVDKTIEHFRKSVSFSPNNKWRIDSLLDLSRAYYATGNYDKSLENLDEVFDISSQKQDILHDDEFARILYNYSVYSGLAGKIDLCLQKLDETISLRTSYFALAAIDQDFNGIRTIINQFLDDKVKLALNDAEYNFKLIIDLMNEMRYEIENNSYLKIIDPQISIAKLKLENSSYTDLIDIKMNSIIIINILKILIEIEQDHKKVELLKMELRVETEELNQFQAKERDALNRLQQVEVRSAKKRKMLAILIRGLAISITFGLVGVVGIIFASASWSGCIEFKDTSPPYGSGLNIGWILGHLIGTPLWAIFNLVLIPAVLVAPFYSSAIIFAAMDDFVQNAGEIREVSYIKPPRHKELITIVNNKNDLICNLNKGLESLYSKTKDLLGKIYWTIN